MTQKRKHESNGFGSRYCLYCFRRMAITFDADTGPRYAERRGIFLMAFVETASSMHRQPGACAPHYVLSALGLPRSYAIIGSVLVPIMMANGIRWCVATTDCGMCNGRLQCVPCNDSLESSRIFGRVSACIFEHMTAPAIPTDLSSPTSTGVKHGFPC